jgi:hypothetical protein
MIAAVHPLYRMVDDSCADHIQVNIRQTAMQMLVGFNSGGMITSPFAGTGE